MDSPEQPLTIRWRGRAPAVARGRGGAGLQLEWLGPPAQLGAPVRHGLVAHLAAPRRRRLEPACAGWRLIPPAGLAPTPAARPRLDTPFGRYLRRERSRGRGAALGGAAGGRRWRASRRPTSRPSPPSPRRWTRRRAGPRASPRWPRRSGPARAPAGRGDRGLARAAQPPVRTTTRPRTCPASRRWRLRRWRRPAPISVAIDSSRAGSRSLASRCQACCAARQRRHHAVDAEQRDAAQDEGHHRGREGRMPCARPQAATAPP